MYLFQHIIIIIIIKHHHTVYLQAECRRQINRSHADIQYNNSPTCAIYELIVSNKQQQIMISYVSYLLTDLALMDHHSLYILFVC